MRLTRLVKLTRREYFADFFITPPLTLALMAWSVWSDFSVWWPLWFAGGLAAWTLYEYGFHRFALHHAPLLKDVHDLHHADQRDYIAVHPAVTIALYVSFAVLFGIGSSALTVGFSTGYVIYAAAHTAFHYAKIGSGHWLFALKRHHALHHTFHNANYGVTTRVWDRLFRTSR